MLNKWPHGKEKNVSEENNWKEAYKQQQQRTDDTKQKSAKIRNITQKDAMVQRPPTSSAHTVRKVFFTIFIGISVVQCIIWAIICVTLRQVISPWWLWSTIPALLIMGVVWAATRKK